MSDAIAKLLEERFGPDMRTSSWSARVTWLVLDSISRQRKAAYSMRSRVFEAIIPYLVGNPDHPMIAGIIAKGDPEDGITEPRVIEKGE